LRVVLAAALNTAVVVELVVTELVQGLPVVVRVQKRR